MHHLTTLPCADALRSLTSGTTAVTRSHICHRHSSVVKLGLVHTAHVPGPCTVSHFPWMECLTAWMSHLLTLSPCLPLMRCTITSTLSKPKTPPLSSSHKLDTAALLQLACTVSHAFLPTQAFSFNTRTTWFLMRPSICAGGATTVTRRSPRVGIAQRLTRARSSATSVACTSAHTCTLSSFRRIARREQDEEAAQDKRKPEGGQAHAHRQDGGGTVADDATSLVSVVVERFDAIGHS